MARLPRMYSDTGLYFVTARTFQARLLLTPSPRVNATLGGVLARAAGLTGVEIHAFVAASNHVHLLVTARGATLSSFMQYFLGNAARKIGRLSHWTGSLWHRRFSAEPVLDDAASIGRLRYILAHGVKEGLVRHPAEWPGLSCLPQLLAGDVERYPFFRWARRWKKGELLEGGENEWDPRWSEEVALKLTPLPCWEALPQTERQRRVKAIVDDVAAEGAEVHRTVMGAAAVAQQAPHSRPLRCKTSPRPPCHSTTTELRREFLAARATWVAAFAQASARFRTGHWTTTFPPWSFRPSLLYNVSLYNVSGT
ncbi:MAG: transposase [Archangium sp.]|nr:transposase [Archangium sp.]